LIYLDVCCYNRPFDDQSQDRIRLESEAVLTILFGCEMGKWQMHGSEVIDFEVSLIPDAERKKRVSAFIVLACDKIKLDNEIKLRARKLVEIGFKAYDALHLACAENGGAKVFLTTDDKLLNRAKRNSGALKVKVENPVLWLMEVTNSEYTGNES
jgi:predicted nucleic acid-binding protein